MNPEILKRLEALRDGQDADLDATLLRVLKHYKFLLDDMATMAEKLIDYMPPDE